MKPRTEITFETEETIVLREGARVSFSYCERCRSNVLMATPQAAAFACGASEREIFRLIEGGLLHFTENGFVLVCMESINKISSVKLGELQ